MGQQLNTKEMIAGIPAVKVRNVLRKMYQSEVTKDWFNEKKIGDRKASELFRELLKLGWLEQVMMTPRSRGECYRLTEAGRGFARASAAPKLKRSSSSKILADLVSRAQSTESDNQLLSKVTELIVFGSYLGHSERIGDIDVAYSIEHKHPDLDIDAYDSVCEESFYAHGRTAKTILDIPAWPEEQVRLRLKNRQRSISLHRTDEFMKLQIANPSPFDVLIGDRESILNRIGAIRTGN